MATETKGRVGGGRGPGRGSLSHPIHVSVVDARQKMWFLVLLHEVLHAEHQLAVNANGNVDADRPESHFDSIHAPKGAGTWYADSLFRSKSSAELLVATLRGSIGEEGKLRPAPLQSLNRVTIQTLYEATVGALLPNKHLVNDFLAKTHVNKRFGYRLDGNGCWSFDDEGMIRMLFPELDFISPRILYRAVRGFFMIPEGQVPDGEATEPVAYCDKHLPTRWSFQDAGHSYKKPPARLKGIELQKWHERQDAAVEVFLAFCGATKTVDEQVRFGKPIADFIDAARRYYLDEKAEMVFCPLPRFYQQHVPSGRATGLGAGAEETGQPPAIPFTNQQETYPGEGFSAFGAALWASYDTDESTLSVRGVFSPYNDTNVRFTWLRIEVSDATDGKVTIGGLPPRPDAKEGPAIPGMGELGPTVDLKAIDTPGLREILRHPIPIAAVRHKGLAFNLSYSVTAPTSSIHPTVGGDNHGGLTPSAVVEEFLKRRLASLDPNWKPKELVPIIEAGRFVFADEEGGGP